MRHVVRWVAPAAIGVAVVVAVTGCSDQQPVPGGTLAARLDSTVESAMVASYPMCGSPPSVGVTSCYTVCAAKVFGVEPRSAQAYAQVDEVFAAVFCEDVDSQHIDSKVSLRVAVKIHDSPPQVLVPNDLQARSKYLEEVNRIFPADVRDKVLDEDFAETELAARADAKARAVPTPTR